MCTRPEVGPGTRPPLEVATIFRAYGEAYRQRHRLSGGQLRVMRAIEACRTALLGGHMAQCDQCGAQVVRYHSCRNCHCPKCHTLAKVKWVEARQQELLPVPYFHCVFTLPHDLNVLAQGNPRQLYGLLFQSASETLQTFGRDPRWLGGELGITMVLHTWNQVLEHHIHVHCVVTGGALAPTGDRWMASTRRAFLFPVKALSKVFRSKYLDALAHTYQQGTLQFTPATHALRDPERFTSYLHALFAQDWVVYAKAPFGSAHHALSYLGRYTHRVAISNNRLVAFHDGQVSFQWRNARRGNAHDIMTLEAEECIRRFLLHVLPRGFMRIRHYGVLGNRCRTSQLAACRALLGQPEPVSRPLESVTVMMHRLTGRDIDRCPQCDKGHLEVIMTIYPLWQIDLLPQETQPP
jgi:Putative transposase/Transposase zinc-binding domain